MVLTPLLEEKREKRDLLKVKKKKSSDTVIIGKYDLCLTVMKIKGITMKTRNMCLLLKF